VAFDVSMSTTLSLPFSLYTQSSAIAYVGVCSSLTMMVSWQGYIILKHRNVVFGSGSGDGEMS